MSRFLIVALAVLASWPCVASPVINEILYRPGASYPEPESLEFIEIHNPDGVPVDLSGWKVSGGVDFVFPPGSSIPAGGFLVLAGDPAALATETGLSGIAGPWNPGQRLSNNGEKLTLSRPEALEFEVVDTVTYADEGDWAFRSWDSLGGWKWITQTNGGGTSLERRNPLLAVDNGQNWGDSGIVGGTPGAPNHLLSDDVAPVIQRVKHSPAVPRSSDVVTISCEVADELPATSLFATLYWRDATTVAPGPFQQVAMINDGNGRFSASLAAMPDKTIVEFYVHASDGSLTRTWPAPGSEGQTANCVYQVEDEVASVTAPTYRLVLTAAENAAYEALAALYTPNSNIFNIAAGDRVFNTTFVAVEGADATIRYRAGMRIRGQSSRKFVNKPLRVSFPNDDLWDGVSKFSLNPKYPWVQFIAMRLFQAAGLPGSDASPVELRRNGVESVTGSGTDPDYGLWVRVAAIDGDLADSHWPDNSDVQVYRKSRGETNWSSNFAVPATPDDSYSGWAKQNRGSRNDWSDVVAFSELWQSVSAPYFTGGAPGDAASGTWTGVPFSDNDIETLSAVIDFDQMARWFAAMTLINNREKSISTGVDNDYAAAWVGDGVNRRLNFVPYDMDNALGKGDSPTGPSFGGLYNMTDVADIFKPLLPLFGNDGSPGNAAFRTKYHTAIRELAGTVFDADTSSNPYPPFYAFIDNHLGNWLPETARNELKSHMTSRQNYLLGLIGAGKITPPPPTSTGSLTQAPAGNLRINEVLAINVSAHPVSGNFPDIIELRNTGGTGIALAGHVIADENNEYVFPAGSGNVPAGGYRIINSDTLGFGLGSNGDRVQLRNSGGVVLDEVVFGPQIADLSIARSAADPDTWVLATPTLNAANGNGVALGSADQISINEWAGNADYRLQEDFVELHNAAASPVGLGGMRLTDKIAAYPSRYTFPDLSFIAASGFLEVDSDQLGFKLNGRFENIWLCGANGTILSDVAVLSQQADASTGLSPDGSDTWANFPVPTPGLSNATVIPGSADLFAGLRITEVMYAPNISGDFEFVELQNVGPVPLTLDGVRFTSGISYAFPAGSTLAPGAYIVVCKNRTSFLARYPGTSGILAPGAFTGSLDNSGETLALSLPAPQDLNILRFRYEPSWYPTTLTGGRSLHTRDQAITDPADWGNSSTWTASANVHGSPGIGEPPVITSTTTAGGVVDATFSYVIAATGSPTSFTASGLPAGLTVDTSTGLISGSPELAGTFPVQIFATGSSGTAQATLTLTVVSYGPLDRFHWEVVPATAEAETSFQVRLTARDAGDRLKLDYSGTAAVRAFTAIPGASPVLITEVTDGPEDQFELQNVTTSPIDTSGWFVVIGDTTTNINARNAATFFLPANLAPGAVLRISDTNSPGRIYFGADIRWSQGNPRGWIMLFDGSTTLRDFVSFGQWTTGNLSGLSINVNGQSIAPVALGKWSGPSIAGDPAKVSANFWQRGGTTDNDNASDWSWSLVDSSLGAPNPVLSLPWVIETPLAVTPAQVTFTAGEFLGPLTVGQAADHVFLEVFDAFDHRGLSSSIDVNPSAILADNDEDGMPDAWETANGLDSGDPSDAALDSDGDGQSNLDEYLAGTDPQSAASVFKITSFTRDPVAETVTIAWSVVAGKVYRVTSSGNLDSWTTRATRLAAADGTESVEISAGGPPPRFFRVELGP